MKPYGNEHCWRIELLTSTKHHPNRSRNLRRGIKRTYRHVRRSQDKRSLRAIVMAA